MRVALEGCEPSGYFECPVCIKTCCLRCGVQPFHSHSVSCAAHAVTSDSAEESLRRWMLETGTKQCPQCHMAVSKQNLGRQSTQYAECHKMICRNCLTRFCFKCLAVLAPGHRSCGCSNAAHGFIDPRTGDHVEHATEPLDPVPAQLPLSMRRSSKRQRKRRAVDASLDEWAAPSSAARRER